MTYNINHFDNPDFHSGQFINFKVLGNLPSTLDHAVIVWSVDGHTFISILNKQCRVVRLALKSCGNAVLRNAEVNFTSNFTGILKCGDFQNIIKINDRISVGF